MHSVVRYRRKLVDANLRQCFPEMTDKERRAIAREFYRRFADYIAETIKFLTISTGEISRRITFEGMDLLESEIGAGRSVCAYFSHTFNWEWVVAMPLASKSVQEGTARMCQVYRPLRNKSFDALMNSMRDRFGALSLPKATVLRSLLRFRAQNIPTVTGFMSDQKPSHGDPTCEVTFLGRPTRMITGTESLAEKLGMTAVYFDLIRIRRGYYKVTVTPLTADPVDADWPLTRAYARRLEATVRRDPPSWLWSHNRWKPMPLPIHHKP